MTRKKDTASSPGLMEENMTVNGITASNTVMVTTPHKKVKSKRVNGRMEKD